MVNTFLVCRDFAESARQLDTRRLNKQITETGQAITTIQLLKEESKEEGKEKKMIGFSRHPAVLQWKDHLDALKHYFNVHRLEALERGIKITAPAYTLSCSVEDIVIPWFVNCPHFWYSHCAALFLKEKWTYKYTLVFPDIYLSHGYFWPSKIDLDALLASPRERELLMYDLATSASATEATKKKKALRRFLRKYCEPRRKESKRCAAVYKSGLYKGLMCDNAVKEKVAEAGGLYCGLHVKKAHT